MNSRTEHLPMDKLIIKVGVAPEASHAGNDSPIFYRLSYEEIKDNPYEFLAKRAVMLQGAHVAHFNIEDYAVTFVYIDGDGDNILIDSASGLLIAMEESKGKLKVIANVKKIVPVAKQDSTNKITAQAPANNNGADKTDFVVVVNKNHPFIHGSQVCTGCHDHPIIGKRWHGVREDGSDINLCEKCNDMYSGGEKLEAVEHDGDLARQKQWRRQHRHKYLTAVEAKKAHRRATSRLTKLTREFAKISTNGESRQNLQCEDDVEAQVLVERDPVGGDEASIDVQLKDWQHVVTNEIPFWQ